MTNCQLSEAIQNLPPELREQILKSLIATKITERATLGWDKVNATIPKLPLCEYRQCLIPIFLCSGNELCALEGCFLEGCCFSCYIRPCSTIHKPKNAKAFLKEEQIENFNEELYFIRLAPFYHYVNDEDFYKRKKAKKMYEHVLVELKSTVSNALENLISN